MSKWIKTIGNCHECRHIDHSGAFTPGGAKMICGHPDAIDMVTRVKGLHYLTKQDFQKINSQNPHEHKEGKEIFKKSGANWENRVLPNDGYSIPSWCPLKHGKGY